MRKLLIPLAALAALAIGAPASAQASDLALGDYNTSISQFEWQLDGFPTPSYVINYQAWEQDPTQAIAFAQTAWSHGTEMFMELGTTGCQCGNVTLQQVTAGDYDSSYLIPLAQAIAAFGHPILVTFDHEMNGNWYPWGYENYTPAQWVAAWQHVYTVMKQYAPNLTFVWAPNIDVDTSYPASSYWPGNNYVDTWGVDCYLSTAGETYASTCGSTVSEVEGVTSDPFMGLTETGIEFTSGRAAALSKFISAVQSAAGAGGYFFYFDKDGSYLASEGQQVMQQEFG